MSAVAGGRRHLRRPGRLKITRFAYIERKRKKKREKTPTRCDDMHLSRLENGNRVAAEAFAVSCWSPIGIIYQTGRKRYFARTDIDKNDTGNSRNCLTDRRERVAISGADRKWKETASRKRRCDNSLIFLAYHSVVLVARTLLATWKLSQVAEDVELMMRHLDVLFEEDPSDALVARRRRQWAQVRPVPVVI